MLEKIGFQKIPDETVIKAQFRSVIVYEARGIISDKGDPIDPSFLEYSEGEVSLSLGDSVNEICRVLIDDDFTDDENEWEKERKTTPPYLVVVTKCPEEFVCSDGYWKNDGEKIVTHDCFPEGRESLRLLEREKTSGVVSSLSALLSSDQYPVVFIKVHREVFAETNLNMRLIDSWGSLSGEGHILSKIDNENLSDKIRYAFSLADSIYPRVGYFFSLAVNEKDRLKKYLYLFLAIEIHIHKTFKELIGDPDLTIPRITPSRISGFARLFDIKEPIQKAKNIFCRFMWCSILQWDDVNNSDVKKFITLKKTRDRIYHGEDVEEKTLPIGEAQSLALKIIRGNL
ncbi:hypothetical protein [Thiolapillus sp.]